MDEEPALEVVEPVPERSESPHHKARYAPMNKQMKLKKQNTAAPVASAKDPKFKKSQRRLRCPNLSSVTQCFCFFVHITIGNRQG